MKTFVLFAVVLIIFVDVSLQLAQLKNCTPDLMLPPHMQNSCVSWTCNGKLFDRVGCESHSCAPGKQQGYTDPDDTKVYPDCCGGPICAP